MTPTEVRPSGLVVPSRTYTAEEIEIARAIRAQGGLRGTLRGERKDPISYLEDRSGRPGMGFRIIETQKPIVLQPLQRGILRFGLILHHFKEYTYSVVKKSGKTTITSGVARWTCENFGAFTEVYCLANDLEQAKGRIYNGVLHSLELDPVWDQGKRILIDERGQTIWRHRERELTFLPTRSTMRAVSNDYKGEAGSNPVATFWSELWGYEHGDDIKLWGEMKPVPTRGWSFRWVETYAGFADKEGPLLDRYEVGVKTNKGATRLDCHTFCDTHDARRTMGRASEASELGVGESGASFWPEGSTIWSPRWTAECDCALHGCGISGHDHHKGPGLPLFVNEDADLFTYWDEQERARRMPWQCGFEGQVPGEDVWSLSDTELKSAAPDGGPVDDFAREAIAVARKEAAERAQKYYRSEYALEPDQQTADRFHKNIWISTQDSFIQIEWWDACAEKLPELEPPIDPNGDGTARFVLPADYDPLKATAAEIRAFPKNRVPLVMGVDAAVSDDAIAISLVSRHPAPDRFDHVAIRKCVILYPPGIGDSGKRGQFDYNAERGLKWWIRYFLSCYNVLQIAYDSYQLHDVMTSLRNEGIVWCKEFSQGTDRMEADKALQTSIMQRSIAWPAQDASSWEWQEAREHLMHADRKIMPTEDTKLRIIKRSKSAKIDFVVATSMARYECKRLDMKAA